jgi:thymidylate synthase
MAVSKFESEYLKLIDKIIDTGEDKIGRNGKTRSIFGEYLDIGSVDKFFPLLQGRKLFYKGVLGELAAMVNSPKHIDDFTSKGCNYWGQWAQPDGTINIDYGNTWYDFNGIDQVARLKDMLVNDPNNRRMIISGWKPDNIDNLDLPCCHFLYQFHVSNNDTLNMLWTQRSVDVMIGLPSDIVFAAAWLIILANEVGLNPGSIKMSLGDTHIYDKHIEGANTYREQCRDIDWTLLSAAMVLPTVVTEPLQLPTYSLKMDKGQSLESFLPDMLEINDYRYNTPIKFELIS